MPVSPANPVMGTVVEASLLESLPVGLEVGECEEEDVVVALPLKGSWAPQGWSARQESAHAFSPIPHALTQFVPHCWQMLYGRVWVNSVRLGLRPLSHTQVAWRVSYSKRVSLMVDVIRVIRMRIRADKQTERCLPAQHIPFAATVVLGDNLRHHIRWRRCSCS